MEATVESEEDIISGAVAVRLARRGRRVTTLPFFAIADVLNEAEENGVDPEVAREAALGYVKGRQIKR